MFSLCLFVWFSSPLLWFCLERGLNTNLRQRAVYNVSLPVFFFQSSPAPVSSRTVFAA